MGGSPQEEKGRMMRGYGTTTITTTKTLLFLVVLLTSFVQSEVQDFAILLAPTDMYIHFADGYLRGPGASIDLTDLTFTAVSDSGMNMNTDETGGGVDDDGGLDDLVPQDNYDGSGENEGDEGEQQPTPAAAGGGSGTETTKTTGEGGGDGDGSDDTTKKNPPLVFRRINELADRQLDGGVDIGGSTTIDIVSFPLPSNCANSRGGCDWTKLGVGAKVKSDGSSSDTLRWCCTNDAIDMGMCNGDEKLGRLIVSEDFTGLQRSVNVPNEGPMAKKLKNDFFDFDDTGRYVVVFANCNEAGREVMVSGEAVWKSTHGYLPGELFGFMYFYTALFAVYVLLFVWYGGLMRLNVESRIPIEKWILMTIFLGLLELLFRTLDYWDWNSNGRQHTYLTYMGILLGVFKHGISWCLIVMVSLGWGVIRDTLGPALHRVIVLGIVYIAVAAARDFMIILAVADMQTMSYEAEVELFDLATILRFVVAAVCVIFIMWILDALNGTMMYLENMNQTRKLKRYLRLRSIFLFAILFATVWAVFSLVNTYDEDGIVREEHEWVVDALQEINYLFVLVAVAILWRPNPSAKEYAYVMELPAMGGEDGTELELTGVVPSAMDDDDEEPSAGRTDNGYHDDVDHNRFKIDDAETA